MVFLSFSVIQRAGSALVHLRGYSNRRRPLDKSPSPTPLSPLSPYRYGQESRLQIQCDRGSGEGVGGWRDFRLTPLTSRGSRIGDWARRLSEDRQQNTKFDKAASIPRHKMSQLPRDGRVPEAGG